MYPYEKPKSDSKISFTGTYWYFSIAFIAPAERYENGEHEFFIPQHDPGNRFYFVSVSPELKITIIFDPNGW